MPPSSPTTDFRGYLQKADPYALAYTGNDAKIDPTKAGYDTSNNAIGSVLNTPGERQKVQDYITGLYKNYLGSQPSTVVQPGATYPGTPAPVYAPRLDIAAVNANARQAAAGAVNPFYVKSLNDYLASAAQDKAQQQQQEQINVQNLQDTLKQTQEANALTGQRSAEDTATKLGQINTAQDQNQTDTGTAADQNAIDLARKQAIGGVTGGGAALGEANTAAANANTTEQRQNEAFGNQATAAKLLQTRSVEDITKSNELATAAEAKGENQAKFDLDKYIQGAATAEQQQRNTLEQQRLQAIQSESQNQAKLAFTRYLAGISNPAQYAAAISTYGGSF